MYMQLNEIKTGLALVLLGLAFGVAMGIAFGLNEDYFKDFVASGIAANPSVHDTQSQEKIWRYAQRSHFHSTGVAAFSTGLLLLVAASNMLPLIKSLSGAFIGLGSLYPLSWLSMFCLAPSLGRGAAHSHLVTEAFAYAGTGGLMLGFLILVSNLFFGAFSSNTDTTA